MNLAIMGAMGTVALRLYSSRSGASVRCPETAIRFAAATTKQGRELPFATSSKERTYRLDIRRFLQVQRTYFQIAVNPF
ncbi:MAG TPA: hypothetical protein VNQ99_04415 [Xanthobacteraceae bacterium]|nr:hypothetical protein [Xanthobacteraceae bacterium]